MVNTGVYSEPHFEEVADFEEIIEADVHKILDEHVHLKLHIGEITQIRQMDKKMVDHIKDLHVGQKLRIKLSSGRGWMQCDILYEPSADNTIIPCS